MQKKLPLVSRCSMVVLCFVSLFFFCFRFLLFLFFFFFLGGGGGAGGVSVKRRQGSRSIVLLLHAVSLVVGVY